MDDMWSIEVWDKIKFFFPDNINGSRIIITTRLSSMSSQLNESYGVGMEFLDKASSWGLFCKIVFGEESIPDELESIGKNIVVNCKGLPLSIVTIGGLMAKSECTTKYWERIDQNLNSIVINNNDEFCLKILRMSYIYLPNYLKPCFLYMGVFEEVCIIRVSTLTSLWVSEGFVKPKSGKCLETTAQEYLMELVDRNLILVHKLGFAGNVRLCKIHDLLRDMCLQENEKMMFYRVIKGTLPNPTHRERGVVFRNVGNWVISQVLGTLSYTRSLTFDECWGSEGVELQAPPHNLRLLRTFKSYDRDALESYICIRYGVYLLEDVFQLVNSRYLAVSVDPSSKFPSSVDFLRNLSTLTLHQDEGEKYCNTRCTICGCDDWHYLTAPVEIWKLHQLRHLEIIGGILILPDPPISSNDHEIVVMENLQTLRGVKNLYLNEEVVKRIPNVKNLYISYDLLKHVGGCLRYLQCLRQEERANCLSYLECFSKLENLHCLLGEGCNLSMQRITFPHSLKRLYLYLKGSYDVELEDILQKTGSLPLLQKLKLHFGSFRTGKWETIEGQFPKLKYLRLEWCEGLQKWTTESSHFPHLQELLLDGMEQLQEIPSEIGEIPTLKSIVLTDCSASLMASARKILKEQKELYGDSCISIVFKRSISHFWDVRHADRIPPRHRRRRFSSRR